MLDLTVIFIYSPGKLLNDLCKTNLNNICFCSRFCWELTERLKKFKATYPISFSNSCFSWLKSATMFFQTASRLRHSTVYSPIKYELVMTVSEKNVQYIIKKEYNRYLKLPVSILRLGVDYLHFQKSSKSLKGMDFCISVFEQLQELLHRKHLTIMLCFNQVF